MFGLDAVTLTSPLRPVAPCAPLSPSGPAGSWPLLKSVATKEPSRTCAPLTAFGTIFRAVTAFRSTSAIHHRLGLILRVLAPFLGGAPAPLPVHRLLGRTPLNGAAPLERAAMRAPHRMSS